MDTDSYLSAVSVNQLDDLPSELTGSDDTVYTHTEAGATPMHLDGPRKLTLEEWQHAVVSLSGSDLLETATTVTTVSSGYGPQFIYTDDIYETTDSILDREDACESGLEDKQLDHDKIRPTYSYIDHMTLPLPRFNHLTSLHRMTKQPFNHVTSEQYGSQVEMVDEEKEKPNDYSELAVVACCVNAMVGWIAILLSHRSRRAWESGYRTRANAFGIASMVTSLVAMVITLVLVVCLLWFFLPRDNMECWIMFPNGTSVVFSGNCPVTS